MGQTSSPFAFHADVDSPSQKGLKSVISDPIVEVTADEFWSLFVLDLNTRPFLAPGIREARPHACGPQGSDEGLLVQQGDRLYEWFLFKDIDEAECYCYGPDLTLSKLESRGTLKVHREPFRLEFWNLVYGQRESGDKLKRDMTRILRTMRSKASCSLNVDSPAGSGLKCVLSDPIVDSILSPEKFWRQTKEVITQKALKVLPDGGIVQKAAPAGSWEIFSAPKEAYTKHVFNESTKEIVSYTYRDVELSEISLETVRHLRIHVRPYRLEMWMASADKRQAGDAERNEIQTLLQCVLEQARLMSGVPHPHYTLASRNELSGLSQEITAFRKEMAGALDVLHKATGNLEDLEVVMLPRPSEALPAGGVGAGLEERLLKEIKSSEKSGSL